MSDFSSMAFIDWNDAFENGTYIPGSADMPERWARESQALREQWLAEGRLECDVAYGKDVRQRFDIARPEGVSKGLVVIVHGGYWHRFDKSSWTFLAQGCLAHGWSVVLPSYRLAPNVSISEITQDVAEAITVASQQVEGPVRLTGHSAGGHLVARMMAEQAPLTDSVFERLAHIVAVSGIYDLRPLMANTMNEQLQLQPDEAAAESPVLHAPLRAPLRAPHNSVPLTLWVGAEERPEFLRQTRLLCEKWSPQLDTITAVYEPGKHHFSVIEGLADAQSALVRCLLHLD